ncbi:hypothetical protein [Roseomonas gilardii]|uniref:hypothetical protein n=1 Tax=Roseomonas gilardii TaxID=257708 RepID=UPI0012EB5A51|nr:hypothetical protein [Roseomonas gilardii]
MPDSAWRSPYQFPLQECRPVWRPPGWWLPHWAWRLLMMAIAFVWLPNGGWKLAIMGGLVLRPVVNWTAVLLAQGWVRRLGPPDPDGWQGW